jgi:hypothetical protein
MKFHPSLLSFAVPLVFAACGDSGVSDSKRLADLTADESRELCLDLAGRFPPRELTCPGETTPRIVFAPPDCETSDDVPATCTAPVGDFNKCISELYGLSDAELGNPMTPPDACAVVFDAKCQSPDQSARTSTTDVVARLRGAVVR